MRNVESSSRPTLTPPGLNLKTSIVIAAVPDDFYPPALNRGGSPKLLLLFSDAGPRRELGSVLPGHRPGEQHWPQRCRHAGPAASGTLGQSSGLAERRRQRASRSLILCPGRRNPRRFPSWTRPRRLTAPCPATRASTRCSSPTLCPSAGPARWGSPPLQPPGCCGWTRRPGLTRVSLPAGGAEARSRVHAGHRRLCVGRPWLPCAVRAGGARRIGRQVQQQQAGCDHMVAAVVRPSRKHFALAPWLSRSRSFVAWRADRWPRCCLPGRLPRCA